MRRITWVKAALKEFGAFPDPVQDRVVFALRVAAEGEKSDAAKPMKGLGAGVSEIAMRHRGDAFRAVYAVQLDDDIWVLHAFRKSRSPALRRLSTKSIWFGQGSDA